MEINEAIEQLGKIQSWDIDLGPRGERDRQALQMAIAALEKLQEDQEVTE